MLRAMSEASNRARRAAAPGRAGGVLTALVAAVALASACGGSVGDEPEVDGGSGGTAGVLATGGSGGVTGGSGGTGGTGGTGGKPIKDAGKDAPHDAGEDRWVDPPCPDAAKPPPDYQCDPFATVSGCAAGEGCYPYVNYPSGRCDFEQFGTVCAPAGSGTQGEPCSGSCAARFVCVRTGDGDQCVEMCVPGGADTCPRGLFCLPVDVDGIGGCF